MVENHHPGNWEPLRRYPALSGALLLLLLSILCFWKLAGTSEYMWMDSPDLANQVLPWWNYQAREWHDGRFPAWEPQQWAGQPLLGQAQPGAAYPLNWLLFLTPLKDGKLRQGYLDAYWILLHYIAALNAFLLCLELRRSWLASVIGGSIFGFLGYAAIVDWPQMVNGLIWAALVMKYLLRAVRGERPWFSAAFAGFWLGVCWLSGHHQVPTFLTYSALGLWTYFGWRQRRLLPLVAVFLMMMFATSALQTLPSYEYGKLAKRWVGAKTEVDWKTPVPYRVHGYYSYPPLRVLGLAVPNFSEGYSGYIGITGLTLGLLGLLTWAVDGWVRRFAMLAGCGLIVALGQHTPVHGWLYAWVPLFEKARSPAAAISIFNLGFCVLTAAGFDLLAKRREELQLLIWRKALWLFAGLLLLIYTATGLVKRDALGDDRTLVSAFLALIFAGLLTLVMRGKTSPAGLAVAFVLMILTESGMSSTYAYVSRDMTRDEGYLPVTLLHDDVAAYLRTRPGPVRAWVDDKAIPYNFGDFHGVAAWGGYLASLSANLLAVDANHQKLQNAMGITHHVGKEPRDAARQKLVFQGAAGVNVYENSEAPGRVWSVRTVFPLRNAAEANAALQGPLDLRTQAFTLGPAPRVAMPVKSCGEDRVRLKHAHGGHITIEANMSCEGLVVLGDTYFPGWLGAVDGRETAVHAVNGILRGIVVPAGRHTVTMDYRPWPMRLGFTLGALALVALFALARWDRSGKNVESPGLAQTLRRDAANLDVA